MKHERVMEVVTYVIVFLAMWIVSPAIGKLLDRLYYPYPVLFSNSWLILLTGGIVAILGFSLVLWTIAVFKTLGKGTPNPKLPPTQLVVSGPYRYSRNPMALGGFLFLLGEAGIYQSPSLAIIAGLFLIILYSNAVYIEEPELIKRFGKPYESYCKAVPRILPRLMQRSIDRNTSLPKT
jgi:protein-S-isoprenylcysteine O-methyltransferase Ste14